jgi:hypothetical protein
MPNTNNENNIKLNLLYLKLKESKELYHKTDQEINDINLEIALLLCPFKIEEIVTLKCNDGKIIKGIIDQVYYFYPNIVDFSLKTINSIPT